MFTTAGCQIVQDSTQDLVQGHQDVQSTLILSLLCTAGMDIIHTIELIMCFFFLVRQMNAGRYLSACIVTINVGDECVC